MARKQPLDLRFSYVAAHYMSVSKFASARRIYDMQTDGCKQRLDEMGREIRRALRSAGISVSLTKTPKAARKRNG